MEICTIGLAPVFAHWLRKTPWRRHYGSRTFRLIGDARPSAIETRICRNCGRSCYRPKVENPEIAICWKCFERRQKARKWAERAEALKRHFLVIESSRKRRSKPSDSLQNTSKAIASSQGTGERRASFNTLARGCEKLSAGLLGDGSSQTSCRTG